jgi:predicted DNA-binding transcriptional regulator AlpA
VEEKQKERLLTREEVERRVGHSCSWIYAMVAKGAFPAPIHLQATTSVRWLESAIDDYINAQVELSRAGASTAAQQSHTRQRWSRRGR